MIPHAHFMISSTKKTTMTKEYADFIEMREPREWIKNLNDYMVSIPVHRVDSTQRNIAPSLFYTEEGVGRRPQEFEQTDRGYDEWGYRLYEHTHANGETKMWMIWERDHQGREIYSEFHSKIDNFPLRRYSDTYNYDDKGRMTYYAHRIEDDTEWETFHYIDRPHETMMSYRHHLGGFCDVTVDQDRVVIKYEDSNKNWWNAEDFPNTKCPFNFRKVMDKVKHNII